MNDNLTYIGIDISKHDLVIDQFGKIITISNNVASIDKFLKKLGQFAGKYRVICEATGGYERLLIAALFAAEIEVCLVHPIRVRQFALASGELAKTDKIDALMLTKYAQAIHPRPLAPRQRLQYQLSELVSRYQQLKLMITQEQNRLYQASDKMLSRWITKSIKGLEEQLDQVQKHIEKLINSYQPLKDLEQRFLKIQGVGKVTAQVIIAKMPEIGHINDRQIAALLGVAPFNHESGKIKKHRSIKGGRADVRKVLYMAALTASRSNPVLAQYYQKLKAKGKPSKVALTALMRKLIILMNRLAKNPDFSLAS